MKFSTAGFSSKWYDAGLFLLVLGSIWVCIFLIFLQPLGGVISQKFAIISGGIGLLLTLPVFGLMWLRPGRIEIPPRKSITLVFFQALFFCLVIWIVLPSLKNIILSPTAHLTLNFQGEKSGYIDITWLRNGLGDISFQSIKLDQTSYIEPQSIRLKLDENGRADLSWRGRVWQEFSVVMNASQPFMVTSSIDSHTQIFEYDPKMVKDYEMVLPVKDGLYYQVINLLVLPFLFITVFYLILLTSIFSRYSNSLVRFQSGMTRKISYQSIVIFTWVGIGVVYGMLALKIVSAGFTNRMYIDDFCYMNILHRYGLFGAILNRYIGLNGRFASHVFNFLAFSFGKTSIPFGPLIALLGVGGSLYYLFTHLLLLKLDNGRSIQRIVRLTSIIFSLIVIVTTSLMAPFLYESIDWTLHSLIVTGSLFLANFFIGLVLYFTSDSPKRFGQTGIALVFALIGFCAMGFSEPAALFLLFIYGLMILILLVYKKIKMYWGMVLGFAFGAVGGFLMVALSPGSANRVGLIGVSLYPEDVIFNLFGLVRMSFRAIFLDHLGIGMVTFFIALLLGYTLGRTLRISLRFEEYFPNIFRTIHPLVVAVFDYDLHSVAIGIG